MAVTTPLVLVSLGGAAFVASPSSRELDQVLPARVQEAIEFARHRLTGMSVRRADGLTWIDVADPRTRKADKLPPTER